MRSRDQPLLKVRNKIRSKEGDYPVPGLAYFPDLPLMKKAPAIPPKIAAAMADAPSTPLASMYGVPDPAPGLSAA